jgi:hypothetical protein
MILQSKDGERWTFEMESKALNAWRTLPGATKPRLIRIPKSLCADKSPEMELELRKQKLLDKGYWLARDESVEASEVDADKTPPKHQFCWSLEMAIDRSWLPADLQKVAAMEDKNLVLRPKGVNELSFKTSGKRAVSTGVQDSMKGLVMLLELKREFLKKGGSLSIAYDSSDGIIKLDDVNGQVAAKQWPELTSELEDRGLKPTSKLGFKTGWSF